MGCGRSPRYGSPCPSAFGAPALNVAGCAVPGEVVELRINGGRPNSVAIVVFGLGRGQIPLPNGCFLLVTPLLPLRRVIPLGGLGRGSHVETLPPGLPPQLRFTLQAFVIDETAPGGFSASRGMEVMLP